MKKIISLFRRDYDDTYLVYDEVVPGAEWVLSGEGHATRKYDGTCCLIRDGRLYKRHELRKGKTPPPDFEPAADVDPATGKQQGWRLVDDTPENKWFNEAFRPDLEDGTYELCGPKVQGNPEDLGEHRLIPHASAERFEAIPRDFDGIKSFMKDFPHEGVVWHHPDGRMVKIKRKDFWKD